MEKKTNRYRLRLDLLQTTHGEPEQPRQLDIEVENHDELFSIIDRMKERNLFGNEAQAVEFALGLKLFSEVMIKHRDHELFTELGPAFGPFMKRVKGK